MKTLIFPFSTSCAFAMLLACFSSAQLSALPAPATASLYDVNNRLTQVNYPDGRQVNYTYDAMGNLLSITTKAVAPPSVIVGNPIAGAIGHAIADYQIQTSRPADVKGYVVTGLPAGLKVNSTLLVNTDGKGPGVIYGTPTAGGTFKVSVSVKTVAGTGSPGFIQAVIDNPFSLVEDRYSLTGAYSGAVDPSSLSGGALGGWLSLSTTATGAFTGTLQLAGLKYAIKGAFDGSTGVAPSITIVRKAPLGNLTLFLTLGLKGPNRGIISGALAEGMSSYPLTISREVWSTTNLASVYGGSVSTRYNLAFDLDPAHSGDDACPQGNGYAALTVTKVGAATLAGVLSDGTAITLSKVLTPDGALPVFLALYSNLGALEGSISLDAGADYATTDNTATGTLFWKRPVSTKVGDKLYAAGFETNLTAHGAAYTAPVTGYRVLNLGNAASHSSTRLDLASGGLGSALHTFLTLSTASKVLTFTPNDHTYSLTFTPSTGAFTGKFTVATPTRTPSFNGMIVWDAGHGMLVGQGFFLLNGALATDPTLSGSVWIGVPP